MSADTFTNFATSTVAGGAGGAGTSLAPTDGTLILATGDGAKFPSTGPFMILLGTTTGTHELAKVNSRSGDTLLSIARHQEGTTAGTWAVGSPVAQVVSAGNMTNLWNRVLAPEFYVEDYGAVGDGTTNDISALQAAITAAQTAGGGRVVLGPNAYAINNTLTITADNVQLVGKGRSSQIVALAGFPASVPMIWVEAPGTGFRRGISFQDFLVLNSATSTAIGIQLDSTYYARMLRVDVEGIYSTSVYLNGSSSYFGAYTLIEGCHIGTPASGGTSAGMGINTNDHEFNIIRGCVFNWFSQSGGIGVRLSNGNNVVEGNTFDECDTSVYLNFTHNNTIKNNQFDRGLTQFLYLNGCYTNRIEGNYFGVFSGTNTGTQACVTLTNSGTKDNLVIGNGFYTLGGWPLAVRETGGVNALTNVYEANDFGVAPVTRLTGIFRNNSGLNPMHPLPAPPAAPTLSTQTTGGTIAAGTYQVEVTYVNAYGETVASASASITTTGSTSTITINHPTDLGNATGWYAYVTQAGGSTYTRQQTSPTVMTSNLTLTAPPTNTGGTPPVSNTTAAFTQPAVPSSTTVFQNTFGCDCAVYIAGGTVSAVAIGGLTTGLTSGQFRVPARDTITLTYTVAPTWVWVGN